MPADLTTERLIAAMRRGEQEYLAHSNTTGVFDADEIKRWELRAILAEAGVSAAGLRWAADDLSGFSEIAALLRALAGVLRNA